MNIIIVIGFLNGRFNIENDQKWKSPLVNGTGETTLLCNPDTFECSPNINGCAPALKCTNNSCGNTPISVINNIYENGQGDYNLMKDGRFNGKPVYNNQWNIMAEDQYFGFNCSDNIEYDPIDTSFFDECIKLLDEEEEEEEDNNEDNLKIKNKCEKFLDIKLDGTNIQLKKNLLSRKRDQIISDNFDIRKNFKPESINSKLLENQRDIINSFYLNENIELSNNEKNQLNNVFKGNRNNVKKQINILQGDVIDDNIPMDNIWG